MPFDPYVPQLAELPAESTLSLGDFDVDDFIERSDDRKPAGYCDAIRQRLRFLQNNAEQDIKDALEVFFPESHEGMIPVSKNIVPMVVSERAKVFRRSSFRVARQKADGSIEELTNDDKIQRTFQRAWREARIVTRLKEANRYTEALEVVFLRLAWDSAQKRICGQHFTGDVTHIVVDPDRPTDLDAGPGVLLRIDSSDPKIERYEFWSAFRHFLVVDGEPVPVGDNLDGVNPYTVAFAPGEDERGIVPVVTFLNHPPSEGLWSLANADLFKESIALSAAATDLQEIVRQQGYSELYIAADQAGQQQMQASQMVRGPGIVHTLPRGAEIQEISPQPSIAPTNDVLKDRLKHSAMLQRLPAGAVLSEARTVAAAEALEIERISLEEYREDSIEQYIEAVDRVWLVFRAIWNARANEHKQPTFDPDIVLVWTPGDLQFRSAQIPSVCPEYVTLNQFRARVGDGPLLKDDGTPHPWGDLLPAELRAEMAKTSAAASVASRLGAVDLGTDITDPPPAEGAAPPKATKDTAQGATGDVQKEALNGAQVQALQELAAAVAGKTLPAETARAIARAAFPTVDDTTLDAIFGPLVEFKPPAPEPAPAPPQHAPPPPPAGG
jgi:hypothetical protein